MTGLKSIHLNLSAELHAKIRKYAKKHQVSEEKVVQLALLEFFDLGPLLEDGRTRREVWDIIDVPDNNS